MGTFILKPVTVSADNNLWQAFVNFVLFPNPTDQQLVDAASLAAVDGNNLQSSSSGLPEAPSVTFSCLGLGLYLDGSLTPINTNNLPPGFTVVSSTIRVGHAPILAGETLNLLRNGSTVGSAIGPVGDGTIEVVLGALTNLALITSVIGVSADLPAAAGTGAFELWIEGVYNTLGFTITPSGGNVESGQSITVAGPNVDKLTYAAEIDNKIIPIDPKITPDGVILEVPKPPTDECLTAFGNCTGCETCFDTCAEDLDSEACQDCLATCFECLETELENMELAEDCLGSTGQAPGEIPITIICSAPEDQFTGTVELGDFTILLTRGSGLYRFVLNKTNDTLYASARDGSTYDVAIPKPFGKTGFFRS